MEFVQVKYPDVKLLQQFIDEAGSSLKSFRYFQKRPLEVIKNHACTFLLVDDGEPVAYGHLDVSDEATIASHCGDGEQKPATEKVIWLGVAVVERVQRAGRSERTPPSPIRARAPPCRAGPRRSRGRRRTGRGAGSGGRGATS